MNVISRLLLVSSSAFYLPLSFASDAVVSVASPSVPSSSAAMAKVLLGLAAIMLLIFGLAWLVKKLGVGGFLPQQGMRVVSSMALGSREKAVLIEVDNQRLLIGVGPGCISTLHAFDISDSADIETAESSDCNNGESQKNSRDDADVQDGLPKNGVVPQDFTTNTAGKIVGFASYLRDVTQMNRR